MTPRPGRPVGRVVLPHDPDRSDAPALFEWELRGQEWSDAHDHDEYAFVLDGELHVTVDGATVVAGPGALVRVPAGARGHYAAPVHARILSVYGPRSPEPCDPQGSLRAIVT
jgi:mannose-6-phosphate isomerase-like protein (cupin superfamily)